MPILIHGGRGLPPIADAARAARRPLPGGAADHRARGHRRPRRRSPGTSPASAGVFFDTSVWSPIDLLELLPARRRRSRSSTRRDYPYGQQPASLLIALGPRALAGLDDEQLATCSPATRAGSPTASRRSSRPRRSGGGTFSQPMAFARIHQYLSMATPLLWTRQPDTIGVLGLALNACDERERPRARSASRSGSCSTAARELWRTLPGARGRAEQRVVDAHDVPARPPRGHPGGDQLVPELRVNGGTYAVDAPVGRDARRGAARRARADRHEDRVRRGPLRRVHRAARRRAGALVHHARAHGRRARGDDDRGPARPSARRRVRPRRRRSSAASARPGRSSRRRRSSAANPEPSREEIRHAMAGNLCRCGAYPKIEEAILHVARLIRTEKEVEGRYEEQWIVVEEDALEQWPAGPLRRSSAARRRESTASSARAARRATRRTSSCPGCCTPPCCARPRARAREEHRPRRRARLPGVRAAIGPGDARRRSRGARLRRARRSRRSRPTRSRRRGPRSRRSTSSGSVLEPLLDPDEAVARGALRHRAARTTSAATSSAALAEADVVVEAEYRTQIVLHNSMETHQSVCDWEGDTLDVYISTQFIWGVRDEVAEELGLPADKVRVVCEFMGGGFGAKNSAGRVHVHRRRAGEAHRAARCTARSTRREENVAAGNRNPTDPAARASARAPTGRSSRSAASTSTPSAGPAGRRRPTGRCRCSTPARTCERSSTARS